MASLELRNICKSYGRAEVIRDVNLTIDDGEFVVFVGPSGCGKSTLLRTISGLEDITSGTIEIGGVKMNNVPAAKRGLAMVFQSYALYPHLRVRENMGFGLKVRKVAKNEIEQRVSEAAQTLKLDELLDRFPRELSGGQRQRVAIGRAIVGNPNVFLFDEPLSNLDAELRVHMRAEISSLHKRLGNTMIYVTHDQIEAMTLADKIVVLRDGQVEQVGTPRELYKSPANMFVAQFIGSPKMNILDANLLSTEKFDHDRVAQNAVWVGLRPENIDVLPAGEGSISARVVTNEYTGAGSLLHLELKDKETLLALHSGDTSPDEGTEISIGFDIDKLYWFDQNQLHIGASTV